MSAFSVQDFYMLLILAPKLVKQNCIQQHRAKRKTRLSKKSTALKSLAMSPSPVVNPLIATVQIPGSQYKALQKTRQSRINIVNINVKNVNDITRTHRQVTSGQVKI